MRAITIPQFGEADVLTLADVPVPEPGPDQVSIDVSHAAVGLVDVLKRQGFFGGEPPMIPGLEAAGTVRAVGSRVTGLRPGEPVVTLSRPTGGGYGEVTVADSAITIPTGDLDPALAVAGVPNTTTALLSLTEVVPLRPGKRVLVHGASGALASIMAQVARHLGAASVVGTARNVRGDWSRLGYDKVVASDTFADELDPVDLIIDPVGGSVRARSLDLLAQLGTLLVVGNASGGEDTLVAANDLWLRNQAVAGFAVGYLLAEAPERAAVAARSALGLLQAGEVVVDYRTLPLENAADAHRLLEAGGVRERIVLTFD